MAVATSSVKPVSRDAVSSGSRSGSPDEAIITPHRSPSTTIGAATDDRIPSAAVVSSISSEASS
jgi:hypothetical protein